MRSPGRETKMTADNKSPNPDLASLRKRIDDLDQRIIELLNERAKVVIEIGEAKRASNVPVYAPDREHTLLNRIADLNLGPLPQKTLRAIYRELSRLLPLSLRWSPITVTHTMLRSSIIVMRIFLMNSPAFCSARPMFDLAGECRLSALGWRLR